MQFVKLCAGVMVVGLALLVPACSKTPTAPTPPPPPPPPPVGNPPSITCGDGINRSTIDATGMAISFDTPPVADGQGSVSVSCSPSSGERFPIGTTEVKCTATDTLNRTASCSFNVTISKLATLSKTRILAFGDSITQGEVTVPISSLTGSTVFSRQIIVPGAAYPTVLSQTLKGRYPAQSQAIEVFNYGNAGEKVAAARPRYFNAVITTRPDVLLLLDGFNDIAMGEDGAASGAASEMRVWIQDAKARGIRVFLATPTPGRIGGNKTIRDLYLVDWSNRMKTLAGTENVVLVDLYAQMLPDAQRYIGVDGLHPNEVGYTRIADLFFQAIQANLEVR